MLAQKPKGKNTPSKKNRWIFLSLWLLGHSFAWIPYMLASQANSGDSLITFAIFVGGFIGGITSLTQYLLIRRQFGKNIKWWFPLSTVAWVLGSIILYTQMFDLDFTTLNFSLQMLVLAGSAILIQMGLLRKHIKQFWLWGLANFAGLTAFSAGLINIDLIAEPNIFTVGLTYALFASATGMTLLWLFGMAQTPAKQKQHSIERLTDTGTHRSNNEFLMDDGQKQTQHLQ